MAHALREHARASAGQWQTDAQRAKQAGATTAEPAQISDLLRSVQYSPDDETEADVIGADIASRAGYDPRAGLTLWRKVDWVAKRRRTPFTLAHPVSDKRLADLKKRQKDMLPLYAKAIGKSVNALPPYRVGQR
jgi:predicted Zn-dependent protease